MNQPPTSDARAILISGGLDSAILLAESLREGAPVHPLYVRCGLSWEGEERRHLDCFLDAIRTSSLCPLQILDVPVADLLDGHWSVTGQNVPDAASPDEAVFLPGRNVLLLGKAMLWCHLHGVPSVALACLESNPFPDATPAFFTAYQKAVNQAVDGTVVIRRPYTGLSKTEVMRRGRDLPLELTFSCIHPIAGLHCGACNKCAERRRAFADAGMKDSTAYHQLLPA